MAQPATPGLFDNINQTVFTFGGLFFAFIFYITAKGDLAKWVGLLSSSAVANPAQAASAASQTALASTASASQPGSSYAAAIGAPYLPALPSLPTLGQPGAS